MRLTTARLRPQSTRSPAADGPDEGFVMPRALVSLPSVTIAGVLCFSLLAVPASAGSAAAPLAGPVSAATLINAGGSSYVDPRGQVWQPDAGFTGGSTSSVSTAIGGTKADSLFQTQRWGMSAYSVPVDWNGTYRVLLKFTETYWTAPGQRVFSVRLEGSSWLNNLDIVQKVGVNRAYSIIKDVNVTDGAVDLGFSESRDEAVVSAISVRPLTADPGPAPQPEPQPNPPGANRSGLAWGSGVFMPGTSKTAVDGFATWRGRPLDAVVTFPARANWYDVTNPSWLYDAWVGTPYTKSVAVAMIPTGEGATVAACAQGAYNDKWVLFGRNIKARGLDDESIIRLGWEFNGNWFPWSAYDPAAWASCWRNIHTSAESVAPALRWDWTVNRGIGQALPDASRAYPGDAYVDVVGVDSYDMWPAVTSEAAWQEQLNGRGGLNEWASFAYAHGKRFSVPEWGVFPAGGAGHEGGDNAFYINKMVDFFAAQGGRLDYECYFNESAAYYGGGIFNPNQNPRASQAYLDRYRP